MTFWSRVRISPTRRAAGGQVDGFWRTNDLHDEGERLRLLERIADPRTERLLNQAGVDAGWRCAELGAGAGSVCRWLSDRVGETGSVVAVDRDVRLLSDVRSRPNVDVVESDLADLVLACGEFDLIHARNVFMHVPDADDVIARLAKGLRPGGVMVLEEGDSYPIAGATSEVFRRTLEPIVLRWQWARHLPRAFQAAGLATSSVFVDAEMLQGRTELAAFWRHTLLSARDLCLGTYGVAEEKFETTLDLLEDTEFCSPFMAVVCISGTLSPEHH